MKKIWMNAALAIVATSLVSSPAHAVVLAPGGTSTTIDQWNLTGETLVTSIQNAALAPPGGGVGQTIFGTYSAWVYSGAGGLLDFVYQVNSSSASKDAIHRITVASFTGFSTDVRYLDETGLIPPSGNTGGVVPNGNPLGTGTIIDRSGDGSVVGYDFSTNSILAGQDSAILVVHTNATAWTSGTISAIDGTTSSNLAFAPTVVPEPSSMAIAGLGALGLIGYGIRRRRGA